MFRTEITKGCPHRGGRKYTMNNRKILIASDSTTDLSPELIREYGISILPLGVALGERQYTDGVDIDPDFIYMHSTFSTCHPPPREDNQQ